MRPRGGVPAAERLTQTGCDPVAERATEQDIFPCWRPTLWRNARRGAAHPDGCDPAAEREISSNRWPTYFRELFNPSAKSKFFLIN